MTKSAFSAALPFFADPVPATNSGRIYPVTFDFAAQALYQFSIPLADIGLYTVQTVWIDNGTNPDSVELVLDGSSIRLIAAPQSQGFYPCLTLPGADLAGQISSSGFVSVTVAFINLALPGQIATWRTV